MRRPKKVLLLGAGGMGMVPLALYLRGAEFELRLMMIVSVSLFGVI